MRIGMFADMYLPHISGVTNYIRMYKRELESRGHEVFVFTWGDRDYVDAEPNVIRSVGVPWGDTGWQVPLGLAEEVRELVPTIDIAHAHHPFGSGRIVLRAARDYGFPVVFTNHTRYDLYADTYANFVPRATRQAFVSRYLAWFDGQVDLVFAPSPEIAEWLAELGATYDAVVLRNAIDTEPFARPSAPVAREAHGFSADDIVCVYVGRISEEKNMGLLTDAFIRASAAEPRLALLVAGDGASEIDSATALAEAGLSDRVRFLGMLDFDTVPNVMAAGDVFVTASVSETYPLVVMEAAAAGLPCVGVRSPGVGEVVEDGVSGILTAENAEEYADALVRIARDTDLRARLSDGARAASAGHDIRVRADELLGHYERLIAVTAHRRTQPTWSQW